ncbi:GNAT family N-acetyltransferase [Paenibacillus tarimensis]
MYKELIVYRGDRPVKAAIRNYTFDDFEAMIEIQKKCFPPPFPPELWWNTEQLKEHVTRFPEGAICAEAEGRLVGSMTALRVNERQLGAAHQWSVITDDGYIRNHDPNGSTLYVVDICVIPEYRGTGIGKWLMQTMYEVVVYLNIDRLLGGGRMPGYHRYTDQASAEEYLRRVTQGHWKDPVITFLLRCGRMPIGVAANYLEDDESLHHAALMEWRNPFKTGHVPRNL